MAFITFRTEPRVCLRKLDTADISRPLPVCTLHSLSRKTRRILCLPPRDRHSCNSRDSLEFEPDFGTSRNLNLQSKLGTNHNCTPLCTITIIIKTMNKKIK